MTYVINTVHLTMYMFLGLSSTVLIIALRLFYVVFNTVNSQRNNSKRSTRDSVKTVIVIGSGGHTSEMMCIVQSLNPIRYSPRLYLMASSDTLSKHKVDEFEKSLSEKGITCKYDIFRIPRSRSVHQSYVTSVFTTLYSTIASVPIMLQFSPELILCNGPGTCIPICIIGFLMRCFFISRNTIIFVESIARVKTMSMTGKILHWFADEIYVQWSELCAQEPRAKYIGRVA